MENPEEISIDAIRGLSTVSWYNRAQGFRQFFAYQEAESVPEGMGFKERLVGQFLTYTARWEDAAGKLMFVPFEGREREQHHGPNSEKRKPLLW